MGSSGGALVCGVALGLAGGLGIGFAAFGGGGAAPDLLASAPGEAPPVPTPAAAATPGTPAPAAPIPAADRPDGPAATPAGTSDLARALAAVPAPVTTRGDGVVRGTTRTPEGDPVAGVVVIAEHWDQSGAVQAPPGGGPPEEPTLEAEVRRWVAAHHRRRATRARAESGPDGTFTLAGLQTTGAYHIQAFKAGWEIELAGQRGWQIRAGDTVALVARRVFDVAVRVEDAGGNALAEARIRVEQDQGNRPGAFSRSSQSYQQWTAAAGTIRLAPGRYRLTAELGEATVMFGGPPAEQRSDATAVSVEPDGPPPTVTLRVRTRPGIRGRITAPPGVAFDTLQVYALRLAEGAEPDLVRLVSEGRSEWVHSAFDGAFTLDDLEPGRWVIGVARQGTETIVAHAVVSVRDRLVTQDLALPAPSADTYLPVQVLDADGRPLADCSFRAAMTVMTHTSVTQVNAVRQSDGTWWIDRAELFDRSTPLPAGVAAQVRLRVTSASHGQRDVEVDRKSRATVTVRFGAPGTVRVTVTGYAGSDLAGKLLLSLDREGAGIEQAFSTQEDEARLSPEGVQVLGPAQAGEYVVVCSVLRGGSRWRHEAVSASRHRVTLHAGEQSLTIALPRLYTVTVTGPKLTAGQELTLAPDDGGAMRFFGGMDATVGDDGRAVFREVPAGRYQLSESSSFGEGMTIEVPAQTSVEYAPTQPNALSVRITDPEGALAKAGFRDGDLVIGVDGQEFESMQHMGMLMAAAQGRASIRLMVDRGGTHIELTVAPKSLMGTSGGGMMMPAHR